MLRHPRVKPEDDAEEEAKPSGKRAPVRREREGGLPLNRTPKRTAGTTVME